MSVIEYAPLLNYFLHQSLTSYKFWTDVLKYRELDQWSPHLVHNQMNLIERVLSRLEEQQSLLLDITLYGRPIGQRHEVVVRPLLNEQSNLQ